MNQPRIDRKRYPRELLRSILLHCTRAFLNETESLAWTDAAVEARDELQPTLERMADDASAHYRRYFGPVGGLRNPQH